MGGANLASLHGRPALGGAERALLGTLLPAPQHLLDLPSGLAYDAVLIWLLYFSKTGTQKFFKLIYGSVFELPSLLLVVTLISEKYRRTISNQSSYQVSTAKACLEFIIEFLWVQKVKLNLIWVLRHFIRFKKLYF